MPLRFFEYDHLPKHLQSVAEDFEKLALIMLATLPDNEQRTMAFQRLLEAKDCAVRAKIMEKD